MLGYETELAPLGEDEEDFPMTLRGRMFSDYILDLTVFQISSLDSQIAQLAYDLFSESDDSEMDAH